MTRRSNDTLSLALLLALASMGCEGNIPTLIDPVSSGAPTATANPLAPTTPTQQNPFEQTQQAPAGPTASADAAEDYVWVSIRWEGADEANAVNLDLHVLDSSGTHIYYLNTGSNDSTGRFAPHDECISFDCDGDEAQPAESIYWERQYMVPGTYEAWVHNAGDRSGSFEIEIVAGDTRITETATVGPDQESSHWAFEIPRPEEEAADCYGQLEARGVDFEPITISAGACTVEDAVMINGPLNGITYRVDWARSTRRFQTSCEVALALYDSAQMMRQHDITTIYHKGSYACRDKRGASGISQHALARAFDYAGFATAGGTEYSVVRHWEHNTSSPRTEAGRVLREIARGLDGYFDLVLDADYNRHHDDHFHAELSGR